MSKAEFSNTPLEISKQQIKCYKDAYQMMEANKVQRVCFYRLKSKYASSILWSQFSKVKTALNVKNNINIHSFRNSFKKHSMKKNLIYKGIFFNSDFIPLMIIVKKYFQVAMVIALSGNCSTDKLLKMTLNDFKGLNSAFLITLQILKLIQYESLL